MVLTSLATKLDIMLTEDADKELVNRTARNIARTGFLVVYQGLVSTYGKEHVSISTTSKLNSGRQYSRGAVFDSMIFRVC